MHTQTKKDTINERTTNTKERDNGRGIDNKEQRHSERHNVKARTSDTNNERQKNRNNNDNAPNKYITIDSNDELNNEIH